MKPRAFMNDHGKGGVAGCDFLLVVYPTMRFISSARWISLHTPETMPR